MHYLFGFCEFICTKHILGVVSLIKETSTRLLISAPLGATLSFSPSSSIIISSQNTSTRFGSTGPNMDNEIRNHAILQFLPKILLWARLEGLFIALFSVLKNSHFISRFNSVLKNNLSKKKVKSENFTTHKAKSKIIPEKYHSAICSKFNRVR